MKKVPEEVEGPSASPVGAGCVGSGASLEITCAASEVSLLTASSDLVSLRKPRVLNLGSSRVGIIKILWFENVEVFPHLMVQHIGQLPGHCCCFGRHLLC